jgi:hypothetical protein
MYEASRGFFAVMSASSAFCAALPAAANCASCTPAGAALLTVHTDRRARRSMGRTSALA